MPLREERHYLTPLFHPGSVALIGAGDAPDPAGAVLARNLASGYQGSAFAVGPHGASVHGIPCHPSIAKVPQRIDLAVIAAPAASLPGLMEECGEAGVHAALVVSAGFAGMGPRGERLERAMLENARRHHLRVVGPGCLGLMRPAIGLNATCARGSARAGSIGFISQSGAACAAMLDWARASDVGFSSVVSLGGSADVDFGEIVDFMVADPLTRHILLYIEAIRDARGFVSALRAAARAKPVILMKAGRHRAATDAGAPGCGVGSDDVFDAVVRRAGVVRVATIGQLFAAAHGLAANVWPKGERLAVIGNGSGPGVMAADRACDLGLPLARLSPATTQSLEAALPPGAARSIPLDLGDDAGPARYSAAIAACAADEGVDAVLALFAPGGVVDPAEAAGAVVEAARAATKPLLACWMGADGVAPARRALAEAGVPVFRNPEGAVEMFGHVASFCRNQRNLLRTPGPLSGEAPPDIAGGRAIVENVLAERRHVLTEMESKALLAAFRIPIAKTVVARTSAEAILLAQELGYPVALKVQSPDIAHKSDAGGVALNLANAQGVRSAWQQIRAAVGRSRPGARIEGIAVEPMVVRPNGRELMVGVVSDPVFGPAITFGPGGAALEVARDRAVALPPLDAFLARELIGATRVSRVLGAFRNLPPVDLDALERLLLRVSEMVCGLPWLAELDINPVIADESGAIACDARVVLRRANPPRRGAYGHMAIHPYPAEFVRQWELPDGRTVTLRPIRPEDASLEEAFIEALSEESRYLRFMSTLRGLTPAMLVRFTQIDYEREMAFIATTGEAGREVAVGVGRYVASPDHESCEFALVIADSWQRHGLGRRLMELLIEVAQARGLKTMIGHVLAQNQGMLRLCRQLGFAIGESPDGPTVKRALLALAAA